MVSVQASEGLPSFLLNSIGKNLTTWPCLTPREARNEILVLCQYKEAWTLKDSMQPQAGRI